ncbi:hypothetical protein ACFVKB_05045 [Rhodococcus sp. NPDC127530]|uniref:hypothetical protein n=1 Tax=unclassified Rhodococcus (in: high G+C Gram-positive bacteria) TaxID=192944 RepID=UPI003641AF45
MTENATATWTPAMQDWLDETMSRATPLAITQEDRIKSEFRKVKLEAPRATEKPATSIVEQMQRIGIGVGTLAAAVGESTDTLLEWLERPGPMSLESLVDIAEVLEVAPSSLL